MGNVHSYGISLARCQWLLACALCACVGCGSNDAGAGDAAQQSMDSGNGMGDAGPCCRADDGAVGGEPDAAIDAAINVDSGHDADSSMADEDAGPEPDPLDFTLGPVVTLNPVGTAPLSALLELETNVASSVCVDIVSASHSRSHCFDGVATEHSVPLLGFRAGLLHDVTVRAVDAAGRELISQPLPVTTAALPVGFCPIQINASDPDRMEPGVTLFFCPEVMRADGGFMVILDSAGNVVWYYRSQAQVGDVRRLESGRLLVMGYAYRNAFEVDMLGARRAHWFATGRDSDPVPAAAVGVDTDSLHHEIFALDATTLVSLSSEVRAVPDYPTSESDLTPRATPTNLVGDLIVEFSRDGTVLAEHSLLDVLDPVRVGYGSFGTLWQDTYMDPSVLDWSHGNAVIHDPRDDTFIVSVRHQDALAKIDRNGGLVWIFGPPDQWSAGFDGQQFTPTGELEWAYHQHAPQITRDGTLMLYDNGNARATPPAAAMAVDVSYSRAVEYALDETLMTATQVWQYRPTPDLYTAFIGDADMLPSTGNVLVTFGALALEEGEPSAIIREVTHTMPAEVLFDVSVEDDNASGSASRYIYRAERLADLYP